MKNYRSFTKFVGLPLLLVIAAACDPAKEAELLIDQGVQAFQAERSAFQSLQGAQSSRQHLPSDALDRWKTSLRTSLLPQLQRISARVNVGGKKEREIRANPAVSDALRRLEAQSAQLLGRDYPSLRLQFIPSWQANEVSQAIAAAERHLNEVQNLVERITGEVRPQNRYRISYSIDSRLKDTLAPCRELVQRLSRRINRGSLCEQAALSQCGHQTTLSCIESGMNQAIRSARSCARSSTERVEVARGTRFDPNSRIARGQELGSSRWIEAVTRPNPNRVAYTQCPAAVPVAGANNPYCAYWEPSVTIYGWNTDGIGRIRISNVGRYLSYRGANGNVQSNSVNVYINDQFKATFVLNGDDEVVWETQRGMAPRGSEIKLMFQNYLASADGSREHGYVAARLNSEDVPELELDVHEVQKYVADSWVPSLINGCHSRTPIER